MNIFLDTSTLFKLYHEEEGTVEIDKLLEEEDVERIYISEITQVEFYSAVGKGVRMGAITRQQGDALLAYFDQDLASYSVIKLDTTVINTAKQLVQTYSNMGLRTLDSIQLASLIKEKENIMIAKTSDAVLEKVFHLEGF